VAAEQRREEACANDDMLWPWVLEMRAEGQSLERIAVWLSEEGLATGRGHTYWHAAQVQRIIERTLDRAAEIASELQIDLASLRTVYRRERGGEIPELIEDEEDR
jgi:hypothetical protein